MNWQSVGRTDGDKQNKKWGFFIHIVFGLIMSQQYHSHFCMENKFSSLFNSCVQALFHSFTRLLGWAERLTVTRPTSGLNTYMNKAKPFMENSTVAWLRDILLTIERTIHLSYPYHRSGTTQKLYLEKFKVGKGGHWCLLGSFFLPQVVQVVGLQHTFS